MLHNITNPGFPCSTQNFTSLIECIRSTIASLATETLSQLYSNASLTFYLDPYTLLRLVALIPRWQ